MAVALVWTGPWDEHLLRTGVWSYGEGRVLALVGSVPAEEYAFMALEVLLVAAWGSSIGRLPSRVIGSPVGPPAVSSWLPWVGLSLLGVVLAVVGGQARYSGMLLLWAGPPMALQRVVAGDILKTYRRDRWVVAAPVFLWLCTADRLALADGIWSIAPAASTGITVLGLPVEEAMFFALTCLLVTDGLILATNATALGRAARLARVGTLGTLGRPNPSAALLRRRFPRAPGPRRRRCRAGR